MPRWLKWTLRVLVVLLAVLAAAYWWLLIESGAPDGAYAIDLAEVRAQADAMPGDKPVDVRVEDVAGLSFPAVATVAGDGWDTVAMPVYAYQLIYPDGRTAVIDTAMDRAMADEMGQSRFDDGAYARVEAAMAKAGFIVVTHEHADHIGGVLRHPDTKAIMQRVLLPPEQARDTEGMGAIAFPAGALTSYAPFEYERYRAITAGVVLIRAPGHTPGSQMVYVKTDTGREFLFIGDVAWKRRNIDLVRERARLVTWLLGEDRQAVLNQLNALNMLALAHPDLVIVPGHDGDVVAGLVATGNLAPGFR